jgi:molybdopterin molybdotransferase
MAAMLSVAEALDRIIGDVTPLGPETVPLEAARGRVLADALAARRTQPPVAVSAMDGYAVRAADAVAGALLTQIGAAPAGHAFDGRLGPGETVRIFTGAPIPEGADAVLMQEYATVVADGRVGVDEAIEPGRHVRRAGVDFVAGAPALAAGTRLDWRLLALAAALDHADVPVTRRPRVAILATGDELVPPGTANVGDAIVASNSFGVGALAADLGAEILDLGIAPDRHEIIAARIAEARAADVDVLVTLGGASVGAHDLIRPVLAEAGMALDFWRIAMRPGKPLLFGRLGRLRVLGLPGNPVSSMVGAKLFLEPLLRRLAGETDVAPVRLPVVLGTALPGNDERADYMRVRLTRDGARLVALPVDNQDSSLLTRLATADALLVRPPHAAAAGIGDPGEVILLGHVPA